MDPQKNAVTHEIDIKMLPAEAKDETAIRRKAASKLNLREDQIQDLRVLRRSVDARSSQPIFLLRVAVYVGEAYEAEPAILAQLKSVADRPAVIIVGAGPAGYFAAMELIEQGLKPIVLDRGTDVRTRRRDLRAIQQFGQVNPHSNYCFGEGGAGTYSDGKLYTRSHKRGTIDKAMQLLVEHGASSEILIDAYPHIGSNKLPNIVANIRATIEHYGGEVHFDSYVTDFILHQGRMLGVVVNEQQEYRGEAVILATGHSARDIYYLLHRHQIALEAKPFALGVRIEHSQQLIDRIQYHLPDRGEHLPAASYKLVTQVAGRGVFSFCMCPGGLVVPAATAPGEIVVNGMSLSRRDSPYANSGTVVAIEMEDLVPFMQHGVFAGLEFQRSVEQAMFNFGDGSQKAPAQRLTDFVKAKISSDLPGSSYIPGLVPAPLHELLPAAIYNRLKQGVADFGRKMKGYYTEDANVIGTESRTSSPIRIPRNAETYMHDGVQGLFPCGEGAGYAGGIISAAMDGQNVAKGVKAFVGG
ncbi:NAD(P)/FAD-dependent oxidoreductase [Haliscomenobacter sp.]|uniref:NAD(P)/FAD-dependent oxidoreductase n=1 Tax=Haliscomenobacter sp. TaxID=2717303 RepID=UPI0035943B97